MNTDSSTSEAPKRASLSRLMRSESFGEKTVLLLLTAVLSGVAVPLIVKSVDAAREHREALSRAQAKLFDDASETILTYETLALDVSWFGTESARSIDMQKRAFERYSERSVDLVAKWRAQASRAQTLASPAISKKLDAFLIRFFREQDTPINRLWTTCGPNCDWQEQHRKSEAMLVEANALIAELANDLGLAK